MAVGIRARLGSLSALGSQSAPLVALHGDPLGPVLVRHDAGRAGLDRSALQPVRPDEEQGAGAVDPDLASRAGIEGSRVFEVDKSADTKAVNAYVTGFWQSKRIVLWDTLIAKLDEPELLVVMGHEMGHYVLGHVVRSILLSSIVTFVGLFLVDRLGRWLVRRYHDRLGFDRLADIASVPLMMMLLEARVPGPEPRRPWLTADIQEHEADRYALDLTRANHAAGTAHVKLQTENLGNPRPGPLYKIFPGEPPEHRRADRFRQLVSSLAFRQLEARLTPDSGRPKNVNNSEMETSSVRH